MLIGAHQSVAGGVHKAWAPADEDGCEAIQIFTKNASMWKEPVIAPDQARAFADARAKAKAGAAPVLSHDSYLINLCGLEAELRIKSREALLQEALRCESLGVDYVVLHPGAHMGAGEAEGLAKIVAGLDAVFATLPEVKTRVALETTAGQGTSIGHTFEQLAWIIERSAHTARLCVCADTAHLFEAGYDISTEEGARETFERFDRIVGLERLVAVHCNDSKTGLGSRVDRHEHLGKGKIGMAPFRFLMRDRRFNAIPKVLETPKGKELVEDRENLEVLRKLAK